MPYAWVEPDVFMEHKGVKIYYVYWDDLIDMPPREYQCGYSELCDDSGCDTFDVRDLAGMLGMPCPGSEEEIRQVIAAAIDAGVLTQDGVREEEAEDPCAE